MHPSEDNKLSPEQLLMADAVAKAVTKSLLDILQSEQLAEKVIGGWTQSLDKFIGRSMRRLGTFVFLGFIVAAAVKFGIIEKITTAAGKF
jgi:hypothetical protein